MEKKSIKKIISEFVELAQENRSVLKGLKNIAVQAQKYELASNLRAVEIDKYPIAKTTSKEYQEAETFGRILAMMDLKVSVENAYKLLSSARMFSDERELDKLAGIEKIQEKSREIFG